MLRFIGRIKRWRQTVVIPVRRYIFLLFCVPFVLLFSALMVVAEHTATQVAVDGAKTQFESVGQRTSESLARAQEPASAWLASMVQNPSQGLQSGHELSSLRVHTTMLDRFPQISALYFGYPNGEFARVLSLVSPAVRVAVKAPERAAYAVQIVKTSSGLPTEEWRFLGPRLDVLSVDARAHSGYDPRTRPWYKAVEGDKPGAAEATDPYMFSFPRQLGMTMSTFLGGQAAGVGGVDFTLSGLSEYLARQKAGPTVQSFIFDGDGHIWAWSQPEQFEAIAKADLAPTFSQMTDPSLRLLPDIAKRVSNTAEAKYAPVFAEGGRDVVGGFSKLSGFGKRDVYVAVLQDRAEVFKDVAALRMRMLVIGFLGLVGGGLIIAWLANGMAKPLRILALQTKLLERFRFTEIKAFPSRTLEVRVLQDALALTRTALAGYARFVPKSLVQHQVALRREPKPGVESREVVALHAVLCGDMHFARGTNDKAFEQFATLARMVDATRGFIDRVENDCVGAIWNAPLIQSNPALRAAEAAFQASEAVARDQREGLPPDLYIAIDIGRAGVGNFGASTGRLIYTAVGSPLDRARALAHEARGQGIALLVTGPVAKAIEHRFVVQFVQMVQLSGDQAAIEIWQVCGRIDNEEPMEWPSGESVLPDAGDIKEPRQRRNRDGGRSSKDPRSVPSSGSSSAPAADTQAKPAPR